LHQESIDQLIQYKEPRCSAFRNILEMSPERIPKSSRGRSRKEQPAGVSEVRPWAFTPKIHGPMIGGGGPVAGNT